MCSILLSAHGGSDETLEPSMDLVIAQLIILSSLYCVVRVVG